MNQKTKTIIKDLKKIKWGSFSSLVSAIGKQLNSPQNRFLKSQIFEQAVVYYSRNILDYTNTPGKDFLHKKSGSYIEFKYQEYSMVTKTTKRIKSKISEIVLMNNFNCKNPTFIKKNYANYIIIADKTLVALIFKKDAIKYLHDTTDGYRLKNFPLDKAIILHYQEEDCIVKDSKILNKLSKVFLDEIKRH